MLNKKQLFVLLLAGSLSSGMYAAEGDAVQAAPQDQPKGVFRYLHVADDYINYGNMPFDWLFGKVKSFGVKTRLGVYTALAWSGWVSKEKIVEEAGNLADSVKRSVGLGSDEDCSRSVPCWNCD